MDYLAPGASLRMALVLSAFAVVASSLAAADEERLKLARDCAESVSKVANEAKTLEDKAYAHLYAAQAWRPLDPERTKKHLQLSWERRHGFGNGSTAARELIATCWLVDQARAREWAAIKKNSSWSLPPSDSQVDWKESRYSSLIVELINNYDVSGALVAVSLAPENLSRGFLEDFSGYLARYDAKKAYGLQKALGVKDGWRRQALRGFSSYSDPDLALKLLKEQGASKAAILHEQISSEGDKQKAASLAAELVKEIKGWPPEKHLQDLDYLQAASRNNPAAAAPIARDLAEYVLKQADTYPRQILAVAGVLAPIDLDQADSLVMAALEKEKTAALLSQHAIGDSIVGGYSQFINTLARSNPQKAATYLERDIRPWEPDLMAEEVFNLVQSMVREGDPAGLDFANQFDEKEVSAALSNGLLLRQMDEDPKLAKELFPKLQLDGYEHRFYRYSVASDLIKRIWESEDSDRLEELFPEPEAIANFFLGQIKKEFLNGGSPIALARRTMAVIDKVEPDRERAYLYGRLSLLVNPMARDTSLFYKLLKS